MTDRTNHIPSVRPSVLDRLARKTLLGRISSISRGELVVQDQVGSENFGASGDLSVSLQIRNPKFYRHALFGGTLSIAESYINGDWDCDNLTDLFRILIRNIDILSRLDGPLSAVVGLVNRTYHRYHANTRHGSRRNIEAHYDLGNEFFELWLDETMAYSCGIFSHLGSTTLEASTGKFDRVCRQLAIQSSDDVVEIGTGWGGFALHAAGNYGCKVTTTTISASQYELARKRVRDAGLSDRVTVLQQDYRDMTGKFDKLVSIEMIEAVGHRFLDAFFGKCSDLLHPHGSMLVQSIVMPERRYEEYLKSVDFIQKYIFPGGCLPSLGAMLNSVGKSTDLRFFQANDFAPHYTETLRRWRQKFWNRIEDVRKLGYSERFIRMWNYYLCYCEAVFEERHIGLLQVQWDKPLCRRDSLGMVQTKQDRLNPSVGCDVHHTGEIPLCSHG